MQVPMQSMADLSAVTAPSERVVRLREQVLKAVQVPIIDFFADERERELLIARSWLQSSAEASHIVRRGMLAGDILRGMTPVIDEDELLVGKFAYRPLTEAEEQELADWERIGIPAMSKPRGITAHMAIDYERVLRLGVAGVRTLIANYRAPLDLARAEDHAKDDFYRACLEALDGMVALSQRYAGHAEALAATALPERAAELREIARICRKVPEYPAETFAEAMQAVHFVTFCQNAGNRMLLFQFGRPDRYLLPYYRRDIAAGQLTPVAAQELIDCAGILLNAYIPRGLAAGYMVGGRDASGLDVTNDLSYLFVQAVGHVRMALPSVGICWTPDTSDALMALASRLLARGYSHPALFNDEVITNGLLRLGLSHRDACEYVHSTCVEITPVGISNVYVASPYYNLMQALHDVLGIPPLGEAAGEMPDICDVDDLWARFKARMRELIRGGVHEVQQQMASRAQVGGFPLLSCFVNDCLAQGRDIDQGGARVNWQECSFVGLANLIDAMAAIRQVVGCEQFVTLAELRAALLANFDGAEELQARLAQVPKYGNDDDRVDSLAQEITTFLQEECARYRTYWGDAVVPGFFCWIMHEQLGAGTCASADGRPAGFPFADGSGPAQGRERQGPTAAIRSVTKWDHSPMIGGIAVNLRFHPADNPDTFATALQPVLQTFLTLGGFEVQVNVVDSATLREAQSHPENYLDLVVRVAGYSDYFVHLPPQMQAEVLKRAELQL